MTDEFKARLADGETLDDLLPEAFATVREAAKRTLGQRHFDVQIMGGAALHLGNIAEMKTGEGKTLVGTLPGVPQRARRQGRARRHRQRLPGRARRPSGWAACTASSASTVGVILAEHDARPSAAQQYACDITYGTNNEFGFDYLRDNMAWSQDELVQRGHNFAIVDEVDSILIDEARTPLIISGPADQADQVVRRVRRASSPKRPSSTATATTRSTRRSAPSAILERGVEQGRGLARHRQPLRVGQHPARRLPQQRASRPRSCSSATRTTSSWTARC